MEEDDIDDDDDDDDGDDDDDDDDGIVRRCSALICCMDASKMTYYRTLFLRIVSHDIYYKTDVVQFTYIVRT